MEFRNDNFKNSASLSERVASFVLTPLGIAITTCFWPIASLLGVSYLVGTRIAYRELNEAYKFYQISPRDNEAGSSKIISDRNDFSYSLPSAPDLSSMISSSNRNQDIDQGDIPPPPRVPTRDLLQRLLHLNQSEDLWTTQHLHFPLTIPLRQ